MDVMEEPKQENCPSLLIIYLLDHFVSTHDLEVANEIETLARFVSALRRLPYLPSDNRMRVNIWVSRGH